METKKIIENEIKWQFVGVFTLTFAILSSCETCLFIAAGNRITLNIDVILTTVGVCLYLGFLFGFAHAFLDGRRNYVNIEETKKTYCKRKAIKFACIINSILFLICLCMFSIITISIIAHS